MTIEQNKKRNKFTVSNSHDYLFFLSKNIERKQISIINHITPDIIQDNTTIFLPSKIYDTKNNLVNINHRNNLLENYRTTIIELTKELKNGYKTNSLNLIQNYVNVNSLNYAYYQKILQQMKIFQREMISQ
jgi:hypothetical protein